ncbi:MFS transporter [Pseudomaricurvus alkylphenolicus]|uniref:MFS transporter n=1 Tax=Pseudomaricurvus alkylphenolicus TaxID=1306991 RepID=UPI0014216323|nr:MFS transporter [Pseudomaricurvus alkylphenolicus]NIB38939.1 MFS transporter [Pseudomaricurvus alkylphenolicus]
MTTTTATTHHRKFHGNKIIGLALFCQMIAITYSIYLFSLFIEPVSTEFSASRTTIGMGPPIVFVFSTLLSPLVGGFIDRGHTRVVMMLGALSMSLGMCLLSLATQLWHIAIIMGIFVGSGAVMLGVMPNSSLIINWFNRRQGIALGIAASGASIGGFLLPPVTSWIIESYGWRQALMSLGIFSLLTLLPAIWRLVIVRPQDIGQTVDGDPQEPASREQANVAAKSKDGAQSGWRDIVLRRNFFTLAFVIGCLNAVAVLLITTLVPLATEQGLSPQSAALVFSGLSCAALVGKFLFGYLCDRIGPRRVMFLIIATYGVGWPFYFLFPSSMGVAIGAVICGLASGGLMPASSSLMVKVFGPGAYARGYSILRVAMAPMVMLPPPLSGYVFDLYDSYVPLLQFSWFIFPVVAVGLLLLRTAEVSALNAQTGSAEVS